MDKNNPYKGLFPYTAADEKCFFGREAEAYELVEMIKNSQLVIIYGESGTGKTSLIHAKLFPELERQYYFPVYIRINYSSMIPPLEQFKKIVHEELVKWDKEIKTFLPGETLIEYAAKTKIFNGLVKPILFFDQFEELFTLGPRYGIAAELDEYVSQLSDLIEIRLPLHLTATGSTSETAPRQPQQRSADESRENVLNYTVVLSLRQDFVAYLDDLRSQMPSVSNNRYGLKKFTVAQALSAIENSVVSSAADNNTSPDAVDKRTAELIIHNVAKLDLGGNTINSKPNVSGSQARIANEDNMDRVGIDPTILSLYCYQLFEEAPGSDHEKTISYEQVERSPAAAVIEHYYVNSLKRNKQRYAVEMYLITSDGRRLLFPLADFIKKSGLSEAEVKELQNETAIFRTYGKDEFREIELAHDQLAKRALISKNKRAAKKIRRNAFIVIGSLALVVATIAIAVLMLVKERETTTSYKYLTRSIKASQNSLQQSLNISKKLMDSVRIKQSLLDSLHQRESHSTVQWRKENQALVQRLVLRGDSLRQIIATLDQVNKDLLTAKASNRTLQGEITSLRSTRVPAEQKTSNAEIPKQLSLASLEFGPISPGNSLAFKEDSLYVIVRSIDKQNTIDLAISKNREPNSAAFLKQGMIKFKQSLSLYYKNHYFIVYCYYISSKKQVHLDLIKMNLQ